MHYRHINTKTNSKEMLFYFRHIHVKTTLKDVSRQHASSSANLLQVRRAYIGTGEITSGKNKQENQGNSKEISKEIRQVVNG